MSYEFAGSLYPTYTSAVLGMLRAWAGDSPEALNESSADIYAEITDSAIAWGDVTIKTPEGSRVVGLDDIREALGRDEDDAPTLYGLYHRLNGDGVVYTTADVQALIHAIKSGAKGARTLDDLHDIVTSAGRLRDRLARTGRPTDQAAEDAIYEMDLGADLDGLPTFGGSVPKDTMAIWSWDEGRLLVGEGALSEWQIISRDEMEEEDA